MQYEENERIAARINQGALRRTFLDPIGSWGPWMHLVVRHPTGVAYQQQCGGLACRQNLVEGYLVPLAPLRHDEDVMLALSSFFHVRGVCAGDLPGRLSPERQHTLQRLVEQIEFFAASDGGDVDEAVLLRLDPERLEEIEEAWIPVVTAAGPGVLLFDNCD